MVRPHCCSKEGLNRGAWTSKEDMILSEYVRVHGDGGWTYLPKKAGLKRCGRSCRLRWLNYLRPNIKHGNISLDEEDLIIRMHRLLGNRWSLIAGRLPGRTDNEIKNYWNTRLRKKLLSVNGSQSKSGASNLKTSSISPPPLKPQEFKSSPLKITTGVIQDEIGRPNSCDGYGCTSRSSDEGFKLFDAKESTNSSTSLCNPLRNDSITDNDSGRTPFAIGDASLVETNMKTSTCSLLDQQPSHSYHFAGDAATFDENFSYLNELCSPQWNLPLSPSYYSTNFLLEEFWAAEINEFENIF